MEIYLRLERANARFPQTKKLQSKKSIDQTVAMTVAVAEEDEELLSVLENKIFGAKRVLVTFLNIILVKSIYLVFRSQFRFSFSFTPQSLRFQFEIQFPFQGVGLFKHFGLGTTKRRGFFGDAHVS